MLTVAGNLTRLTGTRITGPAIFNRCGEKMRRCHLLKQRAASESRAPFSHALSEPDAPANTSPPPSARSTDRLM
jgi:hypothetical protein